MNARRWISLSLALLAAVSFQFDGVLCVAMESLPTNSFVYSLRDFTDLGKAMPYIVGTLVLLLAAIVACHFSGDSNRQRKCLDWVQYLSFCILTFAVTGVCEMAVKMLIGRHRPDGALAFANAIFEPVNFDHLFQSFPSGHTQAVFTFALLLVRRFPHAWLPALLYASLIAITRLLLNAHFLSDVFGGILMAWLGLGLTEWIVQHWRLNEHTVLLPYPTE